ncbi:MAG: hypothetical protein H7222_03170 [Methylotenera sp.]|nr:hypothetical protein [Oligoflexia bacterium]
MKTEKESVCFLSEDQIALLKAGQTLTTCEPRDHLEKLEPGITARHLKSIGTHVLVHDYDERPQGHALVTNALETTFAHPSPVLLNGIGLDSDPDAFREEYREFWPDAFPDIPLGPDTVLIVTVYKWVEDQDQHSQDGDADSEADDELEKLGAEFPDEEIE